MIADAMKDAIHVTTAGKYVGGSIAWSAILERENGCCTNIDTPKGLYDWLWHCKNFGALLFTLHEPRLNDLYERLVRGRGVGFCGRSCVERAAFCGKSDVAAHPLVAYSVKRIQLTSFPLSI